MVNDGARAELFNNEGCIGSASIVLNGNLDNALLDQEHAIGHHVLLAKEPTFLVGGPLHAIDKFLFRQQGQVPKVGDFVHFEHQPQCQVVLILENLFLKQAIERFKCLGELSEVRFSE